jgi:hypothetical protein
MSKAKSALGLVSFHRTSSRTSSCAGSNIEVDPPTSSTGSSSRQHQEVLYTLLRDNHIKFEDKLREEGIQVVEGLGVHANPCHRPRPSIVS